MNCVAARTDARNHRQQAEAIGGRKSLHAVFSGTNDKVPFQIAKWASDELRVTNSPGVRRKGFMQDFGYLARR